METKRNLEGAYKTEHPRLLAWLKPRAGNEAEDILHDIVVRALSNLDSLEPVRDLGAWLWRSARNAAIDAWRKRARRRAAGETEIDDFEAVVDQAWSAAEDEVERDELIEALYETVARLPKEQRAVIEAQSLRGESFKSISKRTGASIETLAARKRYAVAKLRAALGSYL